MEKYFIVILGENVPGEGNGLNVPPAGLLLGGCPAVLDPVPESSLELGDGVLGVSFMARPASVVSISKKHTLSLIQEVSPDLLNSEKELL